MIFHERKECLIIVRVVSNFKITDTSNIFEDPKWMSIKINTFHKLILD